MGRYNELINPLAIDYILKTSVREPELLVRLREETPTHPDARVQVPPKHGQLLQLLVTMSGSLFLLRWRSSRVACSRVGSLIPSALARSFKYSS